MVGVILGIGLNVCYVECVVVILCWSSFLEVDDLMVMFVFFL